MNEAIHRRRIIKTVGTAAIATGVAGCSGGGGSETSGDGADRSESGAADQFLETEPNYDGWFDDVDNYRQTRDLTGQDSVTISVGAGSSGIAFDPPAVAVSPDTTIIWKWTGKGSAHNVAAEDGSFESQTVSEAGHTFEQPISRTGILKYICTPHEALGMKGAIVIED